MIRANEAKEVLKEMLVESGFDMNKPSPKLAWGVFKKFADLKVDCVDDSLLFQCGVYKFTGEELFHFEFVRQFRFNIDEEYDHMEQLNLTFYFKPNTELKELKTNLWTYDTRTIDDFFDRVENMESFRIPIEKYVPFQTEIQQEKV